ncbi:hypothetical protein GJ688_07565 [Heliobacillus mobilis]|uniref:Uncharacterized protein n=1 Tax=Heliobacterium mobile TaxID=28064 RepID=A0A6I3SIY8_HELMO|nr:hypothetical protein [Heliobacterium mobile]MTV48838.1 hypothetical protein [Heliobacterium mobile]
MNKTTLWCLNKAADIIGANVEDFNRTFGNRLTLGERTSFNKQPVDDNKYNLMPGPEYFVPDIAKCVGARFEEGAAYPELKAIQSFYAKQGQPDYKYYWDGRSQKETGCYMATDKFIGYYDILEKTAPNILVGYSQGGLVAKYLAYLDQYVFNKEKKKRVIDAVITISSPLFGSPLANPNNRENIAEALFELLSCISIKLFGEAEELSNHEKRPQGDLFEWVYATLKHIRNTLQNLCPDYAKELIAMLDNWLDWLGGLLGDPKTAFFDLNILRLNEGLSVLSCVNQPVDIKQRAILSTNNSLRDILHPQAAMVIHDVFKYQLNRALNSLPPAEPDFSNLSYLAKSRANMSIDIDYDKAEKIINQRIMDEKISQPISNPLIADRINQYQNGIGELNVKAYAHDFIIPSSYQLMVAKGQILTNNNRPNFEANHMTGSSCEYQAGRENYQLVKEILSDFLDKNS